MLSAVLRSETAIQVSIRIMETFVEMRKYMANASLLYEKMNTMEVRQIAFEDNGQYPPLTAKHMTVFHDRFLIIDETDGYHLGASIKDAGKKCFGINRIEDPKTIQELIDKARTQSTAFQQE